MGSELNSMGTKPAQNLNETAENQNNKAKVLSIEEIKKNFKTLNAEDFKNLPIGGFQCPFCGNNISDGTNVTTDNSAGNFIFSALSLGTINLYRGYRVKNFCCQDFYHYCPKCSNPIAIYYFVGGSKLTDPEKVLNSTTDVKFEVLN